MDLYPQPNEDRVADRPPAKPRGLLVCEILQANRDLAEALYAEPGELARALSVAVYRLSPSALQAVARLTLERLTPTVELSSGTGPNPA